ncbi:hypothetical protein Vafri_12583 [Volvox africanus]|uniref:Uncharacterized protein n=1 Tax=Volvox africanus TaxID=51714 RepID=A0A8J4BBA3_9CHLO|nr:hypothetical protein Vafri_12583 [Volvox africanus]
MALMTPKQSPFWLGGWRHLLHNLSRICSAPQCIVIALPTGSREGTGDCSGFSGLGYIAAAEDDPSGQTLCPFAADNSLRGRRGGQDCLGGCRCGDSVGLSCLPRAVAAQGPQPLAPVKRIFTPSQMRCLARKIVVRPRVGRCVWRDVGAGRGLGVEMARNASHNAGH